MGGNANDKTAIGELTKFLESEALGVESSFSVNTLTKAAQTMFTARGKTCPIMIKSHSGKSYLIKREAINNELDQ